MEPIHPIRLKPGEQDRILAGHSWIYQNEVAGWPATAQPGDLVDVHDHHGSFIGRGYLNPRCTIAVRLLTRDRLPVDRAFFVTRFRHAQAWRERMLDLSSHRTAYRVLYSEGDGVPGLIIDRYGDVLSVQFLTAGIDRRRDVILQALEDVFHPRTIVARNDSSTREREGLVRERRIIFGEPHGEIGVRVNGLDVSIDLLEGQKTGLFLDQIDNYRLVERFASGATVLDCFCYLGLWGLHAARAGANRVTGIDQSETAIQQAGAIATQNRLQDRCTFHVGNVFDELNARVRRGDAYDLIILDPPAFVKSRARIPEAVRGYKEINLRALRLLRPGGVLITCSCSHHLSAEHFRSLLIEAAHDVQRPVRLITQQSQGPDHPIILGMPETEYLKCFVLQRLY